MSRTAKWFLIFSGLSGCMLAAVSPTQAGLIPASVTVTPDSSNFRFTYSVVLPSDYKVKDGDYFTIYDFHGLIPGSNAQPAGWTYSTALLGPTPHAVLPTDDPTVPNVTFTYHGSPIVGDAVIGDFSVDSSLNGQVFGDFASRDHMIINDNSVSNITTTTMPDTNPDGVPPPKTPEPASLFLLGLGVPVIGVWRWLKARCG
jgi:hypothetical protein